MAAAAPTFPDHPNMAGDAQLAAVVRAFISTAASLHQAVVAAHIDDHDSHDGGDHLLLTTTLAAVEASLDWAVQELLMSPDYKSKEPLNIPRACRKIGQDLLLRFDHLRQHQFSWDESAATRNRFRVLWPSIDAEALGARLCDMIDSSHDDELLSLAPGIRRINQQLAAKNAAAKVKNRPTFEISAEEASRGVADEVVNDEPDVKQPRVSKVKNLFGKSATAAAPPSIPHRPKTAPVSLLNDFILDSLAYKSMHDREDEVVQAHAQTFDWVFGNSPVSEHDLPVSGREHQQPLMKWLSSNELGPIYWITGKPGSGKSTFIRYLFQHGTTAQHLQTWSSGQQVCSAGFFFWTSGSAEQRSQKGLLRSLLHQLLSANTQLIPKSFPMLWAKLQGMTTKERIKLSLDWSVPELLDAFQQFIDVAITQMKLCLFVDGLDEFEGDHSVIINFFKDLSQGQHGESIKMCLSSRPWAVFESAFQYAVPNLRLQDLTYNDMYVYARDRMNCEDTMARLFRQHAGFENSIISDIVQRADGVFLWVRLAINELIALSTPELEMDGLREKLASMPSDLDNLFTKLLFEDQNDKKTSEAAAIFLLMRAREIVADAIKDDSANSLTVWEMAFAMDADDDKMALQARVEEAMAEEIDDRTTRTSRRIMQRFAGLLDLHARQRQGNMRAPRFADNKSAAQCEPEKRVTFIHRTVRDWLMEGDGIYSRLAAYASPTFDPHLRLLRSYVLRLKRPLDEVEHHRRLDELWPEIALSMTHARHICVDAYGLQPLLLNEMDETLSWLWLRKPQDPYDHWARNAFGSYEVRMKAAPIWQPFLCLATKFGLVTYIKQELPTRIAAENSTSDEQRQLESDSATPLLAYATEFLCSRNTTMFPLSNPALVEFLLRTTSRINRGANHEYTDFTTRAARTPWIALLRHLRDARRRDWIDFYDTDPSGTARWAEVVRLFVQVGGANVDAVVAADRWDPEITAAGVLDLLDETYGAVEVRELKEMLATARQ